MALRAWLSSRLKALIGTSSQTGSTATVERLLAGLVTSGLDAMLGKPRAEPAEIKDSHKYLTSGKDMKVSYYLVSLVF